MSAPRLSLFPLLFRLCPLLISSLVCTGGIPAEQAANLHGHPLGLCDTQLLAVEVRRFAVPIGASVLQSCLHVLYHSSSFSMS